MDGTEVPQIWQGEPGSASQHAMWIAGRVQVLLSHYFQPDNPAEVQEAAVDEWIEILAPFSRQAIDQACKRYIIDQPRRRPSPGDIRAKVREPKQSEERATGRGDKSKLTPDEMRVLEDEILPKARQWMAIPGLRERGEKTLAYWGEK